MKIDEREHHPDIGVLEAHRDLAGVAPAQEVGSAHGDLVGDIVCLSASPRPPGRGRPELGGPAVLARVDLHDHRVEVGRRSPGT